MYFVRKNLTYSYSKRVTGSNTTVNKKILNIDSKFWLVEHTTLFLTAFMCKYVILIKISIEQTDVRNKLE